ncbi:MAG: class I fructose-bisphosphate aldolase, partial [Candidatus Ranarchaeia archaeon]
MFGKKIRLDKMAYNGKYLVLAMDQGFEHGPADFNEQNIDPDYVLDIAEKTPISAIAIQKGIALKYLDPYCTKVPLLLKLNGKTNIPKDLEPYSQLNATVKEAVQMGAVAVGFTVYVGSPVEWRSYKVLGELERECREYGMPLVLWSYPRGPDVKDKTSREMVAYSARVALEIGADMVKVY